MCIILSVYLIIFYEVQCLMTRQTSVMKWEEHDPTQIFLLSSGPNKHYGQPLCQVLNTELPKHLTDCYTA